MKISIHLQALTGSFETDMKRASKVTQDVMRDIERTMNRAGVVLGASIAAGAAAAVAGLKRAVNAADEMGKASERIGVGTKALSELKFIAEQADVSFEQLQAGMIQMTKRMSEGSAAFSAMGVAVRDSEGKLRDADAVLKELAGVFEVLPDGPEKTRLALELFGRAGANLIPMLNTGKKGFADMAAEAARLGVVISEDTAKDAQEFNDSLTKVRAGLNGIFLQVTREVIPTVKDLAKQFNDPKFQEGFVTIATGATTASAAIVKLISELGRLTTFAAEELAARTKGPARGDIQRIEDAISRQQALIRQIESSARPQLRFSRFATPADVVSLRDAQKELARLQKLLKESEKAAAEAAEAQARLARATGTTADETDELSTEEERAAQIRAELERKLQEYIASLGLTGAATRELREETDQAGESTEELYRHMQDIVDPTREVARLMRDQAAALGGPTVGAANQYAEALEYIAQLERDLLSLGPMSQEMLETLAKARADALAIYQRDLEEANEASDVAAQEMRRTWEQLFDGLGDALGDAIFDGGQAGLDSLENAFENWARSIMRMRLTVPIQAAFMEGSANGGGLSGGLQGVMRGFGNNFGNGTGFTNASGGTNWGNVGQFAGGVYGVYDTYRNGEGGGSGALSGAAAGASAGMVFGPWGAAIGAIIGALAGYFGGGEPTIRVSDRENDATARSLLDDVIGVARDRFPEGTATRFAQAIAQFDNQIAGILENYSGGGEQLERVRAALRDWSIRVEGDAATIENVLERRFGDIMDTFTEEVRAFVMEGIDLEHQVNRLAQVLIWPDKIRGVLEQFRELELLSGMTELEQQTRAVNQQFDQLREEFEAMNATVADLAELERFRQLALADLTGATSEATTVTEEAARSYAEFVAGFTGGGSEFQAALRGLRQQFDESTQRAHELARAAGLQGARVEDLARIEEDYMRQREAMIGDLTATIVQQIVELYGTSAEALERAIGKIDEELSGLGDMRAEGTFGLVMALQREAQLQAERQGLIEQLEAARAAEEALRRQTGALDLARNLADLGLARGVSFGQLAEEFGLDVSRFGADLGLTAEGIEDLIEQLQDDAFTAEAYESGVDRIVQAILDGAAERDEPGRIDLPIEPDPGLKAGSSDLVLEVRQLGTRVNVLAALLEQGNQLAQAQVGEQVATNRALRIATLDNNARRSTRLK